MQKSYSYINPLVSVIVPSYNHGKFIERSLLSILNQTYPNIELIVIDDASSDSTISTIQKMAFKYKFKYKIKDRNLGLIDSLNLGLNMAKGKYFALNASDDFWSPKKIQRQVDHLQEDDNLKISFCEGYNVDQNDRIISKIHYSSRAINRWTFSDVLLKADLPPASFMARTEEMIAVGGYINKFKLDDLPMWLALLRDGGYAEVIKEPLTFYRSHATNTHEVLSEMVLDEHFKIIKYFANKHPHEKLIINEWRLRNANLIARSNISKSIKYLLPVIYKLNDLRLYKCFIKYLFR